MKITRVTVGDLIDLKKEESCIYYGVDSRFSTYKENIIECAEYRYGLGKFNLLVVDGESKGRECFWSSTALSYWNNEIRGTYYENY